MRWGALIIRPPPFDALGRLSLSGLSNWAMSKGSKRHTARSTKLVPITFNEKMPGKKLPQSTYPLVGTHIPDLPRLLRSFL